MNRVVAALAIALFLAASRLFADAVIPPHLRWWLTPVVALQASLLTSYVWHVLARHGRRRVTQ